MAREETMKPIYVFIMIFFVVLIAAPITLCVTDSTKKDVTVESAEDIEGRVKTVYGTDGRPVNQSQYAKGKHTVSGIATMVNGVDTITVNTSTAKGGQDVSFIDNLTYDGTARAVVANGHTYTVIPISGKKFVVVSSDSLDTASVRFTVEGE